MSSGLTNVVTSDVLRKERLASGQWDERTLWGVFRANAAAQPSRTAVVDTAAESEPNDGSVIAMAAQTFLPSRSSCSSVATPEIAALPKP